MSEATELPPLPEAFAALGVRPSLLKGLAAAGFVTPSEIQALLIPRALAGVDILGQARTGTGKTAAFGLPVLQRAVRGVATQAIILVPTRELCTQVEDELKRLAQFTPLRITAVYGGQRIHAQMQHLQHGPEILVGTPGRVIDLLDRQLIDFGNVRFVVLDEVDRMLDIGFRDDIRNILSRVRGVGRRVQDEQPTEPGGSATGSAEVESVSAVEEPAAEPLGSDDVVVPDAHQAGGHQTIFVSATISDEIDRLGRRYMREPVEKLVAPGADEKPTVEQVEQYYVSVQPWDKYRMLRTLLEQQKPELAIVFCRTKRGAEKVAKRLHADGIECREIHGNLAQNKREKVMAGFRKGRFDVLVATDLASRGIDVSNVTHIVNYDIPEDPEAYVHRVGRTARMGATGKAFTLVTREQGGELTKVESLINMVVPQHTPDGWEPRPVPADWTEGKPGDYRPSSPATPVVNRYDRPYVANAAAPGAAPTADGQPAPAAAAAAGADDRQQDPRQPPAAVTAPASAAVPYPHVGHCRVPRGVDRPHLVATDDRVPPHRVVAGRGSHGLAVDEPPHVAAGAGPQRDPLAVGRDGRVADDLLAVRRRLQHDGRHGRGDRRRRGQEPPGRGEARAAGGRRPSSPAGRAGRRRLGRPGRRTRRRRWGCPSRRRPSAGA